MIPANRLRVRPATVDDLDLLTAFSAAMAWETEQRRLDVTRLRQGTQAVIEQPDRGNSMLRNCVRTHRPIQWLWDSC